MKKMKQFMSKLAAFTMASAMTVTGCFDGFSVLKDYSGASNTLAATTTSVTGTKNADQFSWDNANVYFLLTDRFSNGDTSNDHSYGRGLDENGNEVTNVDTRATFHGGDFKGITNKINEGYFDDLGVNALWISAPYEQIHGYLVGSDDKPSYAHYSYHGYYVLDYTQTDANFGTAEEFKTLVETAHEHGIRVVIDIVMNHAGYNSIEDMYEYGFGTLKSGWQSYYYAQTNVNNTDYHSYIDYDSNSSDWAKWWGVDWIRTGVAGYDEGGGNDLTRSLSGLPDFKTESTKTVSIPPLLKTKWTKEGRYDEESSELTSFLSSNGYDMTVTNCISYWLSTWVREYGVDGFRCDTAKHVDKESWGTLSDMCTDALEEWRENNPDEPGADWTDDFWMTGECWDHGVTYDEYYTVGHFDSMINFDTCGAGCLSLDRISGKYNDYAAAINTKDDFNVLSFISSHDETLAGRDDPIYTGSAFLLLPGAVQIYYGDETCRDYVSGVDFDGYGGAGHSLRSDMNWDSINEEALAHWQKVGTFRNNHIAVGAGDNTTVDTSSGVGFVRTYNKNGVTDRVAACIGASANTDVTIDVSAAWTAGSTVTNYYDGSQAEVASDGTVTFNSGANGTILIGDPDGKPSVKITAASKFKGTTTATITVKDADYAIVSIDGGKKFKAYNGDTFTIGSTAYEGDTVSVSYKATNDKGTINSKATFYKAYADEDISGGGGGNDNVDKTAKLHVKVADGSAPYVYAWTGTSTALNGAWPGTQLTEKDSEGYYTITFDDTKTNYNIVVNNGSTAKKTSDITNLLGECYVDISSDYGTITKKGELIDNQSDLVDNTITIRVKPYGSTAPYLYVWSGTASPNGGFPGKQLTTVDAEGYYVYTLDGYASVNCIVSNGSNQNQSPSISAITGSADIVMTAADNSTYDITRIDKVESKFSQMKAAARSIRNLVSTDYTTASWNKLYSYLAAADKLVAQGESDADTTEVNTMLENITNAKAALVMVAPKFTSAKVGSKVISGTAPCEAVVTLTVGGKTYTATADEVTGVWSVTAASALTSSSTLSATCTRNSISSETRTYAMSNGDINGGSEEITTGWVQSGSAWYYYNAAGTAVTGWQKISSKWYYFDASGAMVTGWQKISSKWYYFNASGAMVTGWQKISSKWYYFNGSGVMQSGWQKISSKWYYFKSGVMVTGWQKISGTYYYFNTSGVMQASTWVGNYYLTSTGAMAVSTWIGNYYVGADGAWVKNATK